MAFNEDIMVDDAMAEVKEGDIINLDMNVILGAKTLEKQHILSCTLRQGYD